IGKNRGDFKKQTTWVMIWVAVYTAVYAVFINPVYGFVQLFVCLSFPLLKAYNGERGKMKSMKYLFYIYYPAHLVLCGIIRILLHGNVGVMIGG
ncbi:MAG: conjugal transfer protein TraX, partial [Lachnospiraceae bacterium]|nr:conjugal transfer protein TraX [Lachnospiraceae bacterium]